MSSRVFVVVHRSSHFSQDLNGFFHAFDLRNLLQQIRGRMLDSAPADEIIQNWNNLHVAPISFSIQQHAKPMNSVGGTTLQPDEALVTGRGTGEGMFFKP